MAHRLSGMLKRESALRRLRLEPLEQRTLLDGAGLTMTQDHGEMLIGIGGEGAEIVRDMVLDAEGNRYLAGEFNGTLDFDPGPGVTELASQGDYDVFLAKYSPQGELLWARSGGSTSFDTVDSLTVGPDGHLHMLGGFTELFDADFGPGEDLLVPNGWDSCVVEFDSNGDFVAAGQMSGSDPVYDRLVHGRYMAADNGNRYLVASFQGTVDVDPGSGTQWISAPTGEYAFAVVQFDSTGALMWSRTLHSPDWVQATDFAVDAGGSIHVVGRFVGGLDVDPGAGVVPLVSAGGTDGLVLRLDSAGGFVSAGRIGGAGEDRIDRIAIGPGHEETLIGVYSAEADLDPGPSLSLHETAIAFGSGFVLRLAETGELLWSRTLATGAPEELVLGSDGSVYVAGGFHADDFDPGEEVFHVQSAGRDSFVWKLDGTGDFQWVRTLRSYYLYLGGLAVHDGYVDIAGAFDSPLFATIDGQSAELVAAGSSDLCLARFYDYGQPYEISPTAFEIEENLPAGTVVGEFEVVYPDSLGSHRVWLSDSAGGLFQANVTTLLVENATPLDFERSAARTVFTEVHEVFPEGNQYRYVQFSVASPVTIALRDVDEAPIGVFDRYEYMPGTTLTVSSSDGVLCNDRDPEGQALSAMLLSGPQSGTVTLAPDGSFTYVPKTGWAAPDAFQYRVFDGMQWSAPVDVVLTDIPTLSTTESLFAVGGDGNDYGTGLAIDSEGNCYLSGTFTGTMDADPGPGIYELTTEEYAHFLAKYSPGGELQWAHLVDNAPSDSGGSLTLGPNGYLYWIGEFTGTIDADPGPEVFALESEGQQNIFILQLDVDGQLVRAGQFGGTGYVSAVRVIVQETGELNALLSATSGSLDADPRPGTALVSAGSSVLHYCIARLSPDWKPISVRPLAGPDWQFFINDLALDQSGNAYLAGEFRSAIDFDPGPGVFSLTPLGGADGFLLKLSADGEFASAVQIGGDGCDRVDRISLDPSGEMVISGVFEGIADLDPGPNTVEFGTAGMPVQSFVGGLDSAGNLRWAQIVDGNIGTMSVGSNGDVYLAGHYTAGDFDTSELTYESHGNQTNVWKLDSDGNFQWLRTVRSTSWIAHSTLVATGDCVYVTAGFRGDIEGTINGEPSVLQNRSGHYDVFLARFQDDNDPVQIRADLTAVPENAAAETVVGTVFASYPDQASSLDVLIPYDPDAQFVVYGNELRVQHGATFDFETSDTTSLLIGFSETITAGDFPRYVYFTRRVTIQITDVNETPTPAADAYALDQFGRLTVGAEGGLLANDGDPEGDVLYAMLGQTAAYGTLTVNTDGSFTYTPQPGFSGEDSFTYRAYDGDLYSNPVTVTLNVLPVTDLGGAAYVELPNLDPAGEVLRYRFQAVRGGWATIEDRAADGAVVEIFDKDLQLLATLDGTRFDREVAAGEELLVHVSGPASAAGLRWANLVGVAGSAVSAFGTDDADLFGLDLSGTEYVLTAKELVYTFSPQAVDSIAFHGGSGADTASVLGTAADEQATMAPGEATLTGGGLTVSIAGTETITLFSGGGSDIVDLYDSPSSADAFTGTKSYGRLIGEGFFNVARGFREVRAHATPGMADVARLYGAAGKDLFTASPRAASYAGATFSNSAAGFREVHAFAEGDLADEAVLGDLPDSAETYQGSPGDGRLFSTDPQSPSPFYIRAAGFGDITVTASGGGDYALLIGSAEDDTFSAAGDRADFTGPGFAHHVSGFPLTETAAKAGANDQAFYTGTEHLESFNGTYVYGRWAVYPSDGGEYLYRAVRFDHVTATTTPDSPDTARFEDSIYGDVFEAEAYAARMYNLRCDNRAEGFAWINAYALNGGGNTAHLTYSSATDTLVMGPTNCRFYCQTGDPPAYFVRAWHFDEVLTHDLAPPAEQALLAPGPADDLTDVADQTDWSDLAAALAAPDSNSTRSATTASASQAARDRLFALLLDSN